MGRKIFDAHCTSFQRKRLNQLQMIISSKSFTSYDKHILLYSSCAKVPSLCSTATIQFVNAPGSGLTCNVRPKASDRYLRFKRNLSRDIHVPCIHSLRPSIRYNFSVNRIRDFVAIRATHSKSALSSPFSLPLFVIFRFFASLSIEPLLSTVIFTHCYGGISLIPLFL